MEKIEKILVIGSNSFSGGHCVNYFLENTDAEVIGISRSEEYDSIFLPYLYKKEKKPEKFTFYKLDINKNLKEISDLLDDKKPNVVINFSAQGNVQFSWTNPEDWFRTNCLGIVNLTNMLKDKKYIEKYVHISTPEVYGTTTPNFKENLNHFNPSSPYAASKAAGDLFLITLMKNFNFPVVFTRYANAYGIHQQLYRIIPRSIIYLKMGKKIPLHNGGKQIRSFIHIKDVSSAIHKVVLNGKNGEVYHFSTKLDSISNLVRKICEQTGNEFEKSVEVIEARKEQDLVYDLNCDKAKKDLGWEQKISLDEGISKMVDWINDCWDEIKKQPLEYVHKK